MSRLKHWSGFHCTPDHLAGFNMATLLLVLLPAVAYGHRTYLLPNDYGKSDPPAMYDKAGKKIPLQISLQLRIVEVLGIKDYEEEITLDVIASYSWVETRILSSNSTEEAEQEHPLEETESTRFWKPPFYIEQMTRLSVTLGKMDLSYLIISPGNIMKSLQRANTVIKCKFYFALFPLDIQKCNMDFMSPLNNMKDVHLMWGWPAAVISDKGGDGKYLLPQYEASLLICNFTFLHPHVAGNVSALRLWLVLKRQLLSHFLELYVPTGLFVVISWGSFLVRPEIVPGRMVLLVTNLLSLVTLFEASRRASPPAIQVKVADIWILSCIVFVFLALLEYAFILFSTRSTSQEVVKSKDNLSRVQHLKLFTTVLSLDSGRIAQRPRPLGYPHRFRCSLRNVLRRLFEWLKSSPSGSWILLDKLSLILFPALFAIYNMIYWNIVLSKREVFMDHMCPGLWEYADD